MNAPTRPVLRYHGGKWRLREWVIGHLPPHQIYVEPYGGVASVLLAKPRSPVEIYNDLDERVVNVFRVLRDPAQAAELERRLRLTPWARAELEAAYEPTDDPVEQARRTIVRQMFGFGSSGLVQGRTGFRATAYRNRNQDYAKDWAAYPDAIAAFTARLQGVTIERLPALRLIDMHDTPRTLFYVDPPYPHSTRGRVEGNGHNGYLHEMGDDDHRALATALRSVKGMVVLSGYPCDLYDGELFPDWHRIERRNCAQGNRGAAWRTEVLWLNDAAARHQQLSFFAEVG